MFFGVLAVDAHVVVYHYYSREAISDMIHTYLESIL